MTKTKQLIERYASELGIHLQLLELTVHTGRLHNKVNITNYKSYCLFAIFSPLLYLLSPVLGHGEVEAYSAPAWRRRDTPWTVRHRPTQRQSTTFLRTMFLDCQRKLEFPDENPYMHKENMQNPHQKDPAGIRTRAFLL